MKLVIIVAVILLLNCMLSAHVNVSVTNLINIGSASVVGKHPETPNLKG
jgi:hypothetical protein